MLKGRQQIEGLKVSYCLTLYLLIYLSSVMFFLSNLVIRWSSGSYDGVHEHG
jgi:hypothetical protein